MNRSLTLAAAMLPILFAGGYACATRDYQLRDAAATHVGSDLDRRRPRRRPFRAPLAARSRSGRRWTCV